MTSGAACAFIPPLRSNNNLFAISYCRHVRRIVVRFWDHTVVRNYFPRRLHAGELRCQLLGEAILQIIETSIELRCISISEWLFVQFAVAEISSYPVAQNDRFWNDGLVVLVLKINWRCLSGSHDIEFGHRIIITVRRRRGSLSTAQETGEGIRRERGRIDHLVVYFHAVEIAALKLGSIVNYQRGRCGGDSPVERGRRGCGRW